MIIEDFTRKHREFSLCGLNCSLCPRYHTEGSSRCPGCGGDDFNRKHPSCSVINCNKKNGALEYCFDCKQYPCLRYAKPSEKDSFITYRDVTKNLNKAKENIEEYLRELEEKERLLVFLLDKYDNGRSKNFYCIAVNLLKAEDISDVVAMVEKKVKEKDESMIRAIKEGIEAAAKAKGIEIRLRK